METALLKVKRDLLEAMDNKKVTYLVLLDLSVAFDMVSHDLLLNWLKYSLSAWYWGELWPDNPTYARLSNFLYTAELCT